MDVLSRNMVQMYVEAQRIAKIGCWELDLLNNNLIWSDEIFCIFEIDSDRFDASYESFLDAIHPDDREAVNHAYSESVKNRTPYEIEHRLLMPDGRVKYVIERCKTDYDSSGNPLRSFGTVQDITERRSIEERLIKREQEFRALAENSPDPIARYDSDCRRIYANKAFADLMGMPINKLLYVTPCHVFPDSTEMQFFEEKLQRVLVSGEEAEHELAWLSKGKVISIHIRLVPERDINDEVESVLTVSRDVTAVGEYRREIHRLAFFDSLTELPNRALFNERLKQVLSNADRHEHLTGLMMMDLDHFKLVNDTLGHPAGDLLLQKVAARLKEAVRDYDTVSRLGGDEFALIFPEIRYEYDVTSIAKKIKKIFASPFRIENRELFVSPSIGIALSPKDGHDSDELFKCADSALYHAKYNGRNCYKLYSEELSLKAKEHFEIESALRKAIENDELELFYQPQVDLAKGKLLGAEALIRWNHPERGLLMPDKFIGIAEDTGLIVSVGEWVLREACKAVVKWNRNGAGSYRVAVNVSTRQFYMNDFPVSVRKILNETNCHPDWLELEITESLLLENNDEINVMLEGLNEIGVSLAIDDFGTGYSALGYLNRFPIKIIKIDRSFINNIAYDIKSAGLVKAIIAMAYSLKLGLVSEGVETPQQEELLRAWGCHMGQGYLYGRPTKLLEFENILNQSGGGGVRLSVGS